MGSFEFFAILAVGLVVVSRTCDAINCQFVAPPETAGTDGPELGLIFIPGSVINSEKSSFKLTGELNSKEGCMYVCCSLIMHAIRELEKFD